MNGNGIIDNGAELFGDNTKLADGSFAKHGYAALAELDSNGDGIVSAADAAFQTLRVWQDLNQDGISQANELRTLETLGIQSLDVAYKDANKNLGNGNTLVQQGSYTKTDGTVAQAGDLLLAADNLHSRFKDKVELTAEQAQAANLAGIGRLRDLREAAALSGDLANVLKAYSAADTKEAQLALLDSLIHEWAETDSEWGKKPPMHLSTSWTQTANGGVALTPSQVTRLKQNALVSLSDKAKAAIDAARDRIAVLDAYTGQDSSTLYYMSEEDALNIVKVTNDTYENLAKNIYQSLLLQTRLRPYLNQIGFKMENGIFTLDYAGLTAAFNQVYESNPQKAFTDLGELLAYGKLAGWTEGRILLNRYIQAARESGVLETFTTALGKEAIDLISQTKGTDGDDVLQDVEWSGKKDVTLSGGAGDDMLVGGEGSDGLYGGAGDDILIAGAGDDRLEGDAGNDTLIGGEGNDKLYGGSGDDTYVFAKGHGSDYVLDGEGKQVFRFDGINTGEMQFRRIDNDLELFGYNGSDSVRVGNYFWSEAHRNITFQFADKTVTLDNLMQNGLALQGTDAGETIYGWAGRNELYGHGGNDALDGGSQSDILDGGSGDDKLEGEGGNDTLIGGEGNDKLYGGSGDDTYVFAKGHGSDYVLDGEGKQVFRFDGINTGEMQFRRIDNDLELFGYNGNDSVKIGNYFWSDAHRNITFQFVDKTVTLENLMQNGLALQGTDAGETIYGWAGRNELYGHGGNDALDGGSQSDILDGGSGDDTLKGEGGNDTLIGGEGNDKLYGDVGDDTYVFAKGHGSDYVSDGQGKQVFHFKDINAGEMQFRRIDNDLELFGYNGNDSVKIGNYFWSDEYRNIEFQFADQTIDKPDIAHYANAANNLVQTMAAFGNGGNAGEGLTNTAVQPVQPLLATSAV